VLLDVPDELQQVHRRRYILVNLHEPVFDMPKYLQQRLLKIALKNGVLA